MGRVGEGGSCMVGFWLGGEVWGGLGSWSRIEGFGGVVVVVVRRVGYFGGFRRERDWWS